MLVDIVEDPGRRQSMCTPRLNDPGMRDACTERIPMKPVLLLMTLIWFPFLSIFAFANPALAERVGDS